MVYQLYIPIIFPLFASILEAIAEYRNKDIVIFNRKLALIAGLAVFFSIIAGTSFVETPMNLNSEYASLPLHQRANIQHHWGYVFSTLQCILFLLGSMLAPRIPLVKVKMSRVYLFFALLLFLSLVQDFVSFILGMLVLYPLLAISVVVHVKSLLDDSRKLIRVRAFTKYHILTSTFLLLALLDHLLIKSPDLMLTKFGSVTLTIATFSAVGLFPFHSWVQPFMGAPRSTIFLPLFCIQAGLLLLFRLYLPLVSTDPEIMKISSYCAIVGLFYGTILLFGENRLKRIPGYLYISHISLMVIGITSLGLDGQIASILDSVNLLISSSGLITVCALLTGRFGVNGVLFPRGLVSNFPVLGVCYLLSALSLVGFPGTLGFIEEELIIESGLANHYILVFFVALAFTLNGFSCFRLFARIFYGYKSEAIDNDMKLSGREKFAICTTLLLIVVNGLMPNILFKLLGALG